MTRTLIHGQRLCRDAGSSLLAQTRQIPSPRHLSQSLVRRAGPEDRSPPAPKTVSPTHHKSGDNGPSAAAALESPAPTSRGSMMSGLSSLMASSTPPVNASATDAIDPKERTPLSGFPGRFIKRPPHSAGLGGLARLLGSSDISSATLLPSHANYDGAAISDATVYPPALSKPPHHMHIFSTKHNTHITLTHPNRDTIISVACGNLGLKKSQRGSFDAAYQLASFTMNKITEQGLNLEIEKLEIILRGFGPGRDAVTKALMGQEGRGLREKVVRVTDATRLKFGGTRSPKPRRLG